MSSAEVVSALLGPPDAAALWDLLQAAVQNDAVRVASLAASVSDVNYRNAQGRTALMIAAANGCVDAVRALVTAGADLRLQDDEGMTALHFGVMAGSDDMVEALLALGSPAAAPSLAMDTPLHFAAEMGRVDLVELLLDAGAPLFLLNRHGDSPVAIATAHGHKETVQVLLARGGDPAVVVECALLSSPAWLDGVALVLELQPGAAPFDVNNVLPSTKLTPLCVAAARGDVPTLEYLYGRGCRVDGSDAVAKAAVCPSPLTSAIQHRSLPAVEWLLKKGASPGKADGRGISPLYVVCLAGCQHGAAPAPTVLKVWEQPFTAAVGPTPGLPAVSLAGEEGDAIGVAIMDMLVDAGASTNPLPSPLQACAKSGRLPLLTAWFRLHFHGDPARLSSLPVSGIALGDAVKGGMWLTALALLAAGAPLFGDRRIDLACAVLEAKGPVALVRALLTTPPSPDHTKKLLSAALTGGEGEGVDAVVAAAGDVCTPDFLSGPVNGAPLLLAAVRGGKAACATRLLAHGASPVCLKDLLSPGDAFTTVGLLSHLLPYVFASPGGLPLLVALSAVPLVGSPTEGPQEDAPLVALARVAGTASDAVAFAHVLLSHGLSHGISLAVAEACGAGNTALVRALRSHTEGLAALDDSGATRAASPSLSCLRLSRWDLFAELFLEDPAPVRTACAKWGAAGASILLSALAAARRGPESAPSDVTACLDALASECVQHTAEAM